MIKFNLRTGWNMKKVTTNKSSIEIKFTVLTDLIVSIYHEIKAIYDNKDYIEWTKLNDEWLKINTRNKEIISSLFKEPSAECKEAQKLKCEFMLYSMYVKAMEYKSESDALYQAYIESIKPHEREYILNEQKMSQINEQLKPYEKNVNELIEQLNELWAAANYLLKQIDLIDSAFKISDDLKIKIVEQRLYSYSQNKKLLLDKTLQKEKKQYEEAKASRIKFYTSILTDMPRPPKGSHIPDPTGEAIISIEENIGEIIKSWEKKINKTIESIQWVDKVLKTLEPDEARIIRLRYLENKSWNQITTSTGWPERTCYCKRDTAINKLIDLL